MSMFEQIGKDLMQAMKAREQAKMRALQGIKAQLLLLRTEKGSGTEISDADEIKVLQRMAKQRRDSLEIFEKEGRLDLAQKEKEELEVIELYLPKQLSDAELEVKIKEIILKLGVNSPAQIGMVMGAASKELAGLADGKRISEVAKQLLNQG